MLPDERHGRHTLPNQRMVRVFKNRVILELKQYNLITLYLHPQKEKVADCTFPNLSLFLQCLHAEGACCNLISVQTRSVKKCYYTVYETNPISDMQVQVQKVQPFNFNCKSGTPISTSLEFSDINTPNITALQQHTNMAVNILTAQYV